MQVTGYVLIAGNAIESLGLNNLRIIRGETLLMSDGESDTPTSYSLYVAFNYRLGHVPFGGLMELQLASLRGQQNLALQRETKWNRSFAFVRHFVHLGHYCFF